MTTYAISLVDDKTGSQAYLGKTEADRFDESCLVFEAETLAEVATWILKNVRGARRYTEAGEWRPVARRFVRVKLFRKDADRLTAYPDRIVMNDLPEWITKNA